MERKRKNYNNLTISRKKSFLDGIKFLIVSKGLSFGEKKNNSGQELYKASSLPKMFEGVLIEKLMF